LSAATFAVRDILRAMDTEPATPRFHCPEGLAIGATVALPDRAAQHVRVLRLEAGAAVTLFAGAGGEFAGELLDVSKRGVTVRVRAHRDVSVESPLAIALVQGLCSGERMDWIVQKATELGVSDIRPFVAARSQGRLSDERQMRRLAHWRAVAAAACEQSGRNRVPEVHPLVELEAALAPPRTGVSLLLSPRGEATLAALPPVAAATILVGPEGGLTERETSVALRAGFKAFRFGPRVLRTETAPLAVIAALQARWGDC
jgi:16S rRNA (uracil1498-N3)-methyltransferase